MLTPKRIYVEELLDAGEGTDDDVARNLSDLRRINRFLGGSKVVLSAISSLIENNNLKRLSLLDVGTGSADIPTAALAWCEQRGISAMVSALDISERNLRIARSRLGVSRKIQFVRADSLNLPFAAKSFDFVTASLFLHHFQDDDVVRLLSDFASIARRAVIVNDLVRNMAPYYFAKLTGPFLATSFLTRNDGPISVLRGFTAEELKRLAERAGLRRFEVRRSFPYRLSLIAEVSEV
jgi:SAM-dependent methyltransferase